MEADEDEMARRAAAARKQLERMFREPPGQAYDGEDGGPGQVDEEELEAELEELEDELREEMDDWYGVFLGRPTASLHIECVFTQLSLLSRVTHVVVLRHS